MKFETIKKLPSECEGPFSNRRKGALGPRKSKWYEIKKSIVDANGDWICIEPENFRSSKYYCSVFSKRTNRSWLPIGKRFECRMHPTENKFYVRLVEE